MSAGPRNHRRLREHMSGGGVELKEKPIGRRTLLDKLRVLVAPLFSELNSLEAATTLKGAGLARRLLELLIQSASRHGFAQMEGDILASNRRMLRLAKRLGFVSVENPEGPTVRKVRCDRTRRVRLGSGT